MDLVWIQLEGMKNALKTQNRNLQEIFVLGSQQLRSTSTGFLKQIRIQIIRYTVVICFVGDGEDNEKWLINAGTIY